MSETQKNKAQIHKAQQRKAQKSESQVWRMKLKYMRARLGNVRAKLGNMRAKLGNVRAGLKNMRAKLKNVKAPKIFFGDQQNKALACLVIATIRSKIVKKQSINNSVGCRLKIIDSKKH